MENTTTEAQTETPQEVQYPEPENHFQVLLDEEGIGQESLPKEIKDLIHGYNMTLGRYLKKPTQNAKSQLEAKSALIASKIQDYIDAENDEPEDELEIQVNKILDMAKETPAPTTQAQETPETPAATTEAPVQENPPTSPPAQETPKPPAPTQLSDAEFLAAVKAKLKNGNLISGKDLSEVLGEDTKLRSVIKRGKFRFEKILLRNEYRSYLVE